MGFSRQEYWNGLHSLLQWTTFCQTSPPWPIRLGWPHTAWLSFIELDKAVVLWSDWLVVCDYGLSVGKLWELVMDRERLACCDSWGRKESNMTEQLNWTELNWTEVHPGIAGEVGIKVFIQRWQHSLLLIDCKQPRYPTTEEDLSKLE